MHQWRSAQRHSPSLLFFHRLWISLTTRYSCPIQHLLSVIQLVVLGRLMRLFCHAIAGRRQTQGSVPQLTPTLVVCNCFIALVQLQVATVNVLSSGTTTCIYLFINSILKSLVILVLWLVLSGAIYSRIALSFALNHIFFAANENGTVKQNNQSDFKALLNSPITL